MILVLSHPEELNTEARSRVSGTLLEKLEDLPALTPGKYAVYSVEKLAEFQVARDTGLVDASAVFPPSLLFARYADGTAEVVTPSGVLTLPAPFTPCPEQEESSA